MLEIVYRDETLIAVNKPHGLLVHKTTLAADADIFALQILRDQINMPVFPVHRLDRKTGGILLFALDKDTDRTMQQQFSSRLVHKKYLAVVRGFTAEDTAIDYPLKNEKRGLQEALTFFRTLDHAEMDMPSGKHTTSRYSLVEVTPETGRMHQIRKHFAHILHPIIGDRPHGCNKQNKLWLERFGMNTMMLHASELRFNHPVSGKPVHIKADIQEEFRRVKSILGFKK